jgi:hypothetical protein
MRVSTIYLTSSVLFITIFFLTVLTFADAYPAKVITCTFQYTYIVHGISDIVEYENHSNRQEIIQQTDTYVKVKNTVNLNPMDSQAPYPPEKDAYDEHRRFLQLDELNQMETDIPEALSNGTRIIYNNISLADAEQQAIRDVALDLMDNITTQQEAVEAVMFFIRDRVRYQLRSSPHPIQVLRTGRAYCEGYANTAIALIRALGFPARWRTCYIPPGKQWGFGNQGGDHAYLEVYYPDLGWVSYDPQSSVHFVDPYHIEGIDQLSLILLSDRTGQRVQINVENVEDQKDYILLDGSKRTTHYRDFFIRDRNQSEQNHSLIVGDIRDHTGSVFPEDWVYIYREEIRRFEGYPLMENGSYYIMNLQLDTPYTFYFKYPGYFAHQIHTFHEVQRYEQSFYFNDPTTISLESPNQRTQTIYFVYNYSKDESGRTSWQYKALETDSHGKLYLLLEPGKDYLFSRTQRPNNMITINTSQNQSVYRFE